MSRAACLDWQVLLALRTHKYGSVILAQALIPGWESRLSNGLAMALTVRHFSSRDNISTVRHRHPGMQLRHQDSPLAGLQAVLEAVQRDPGLLPGRRLAQPL
jgi:hypothetical protein